MNTDIPILTAIPLLLKFMLVFGMAIYALFAFIMVRQEQLMARVFSGANEPVLRLLALIHLAGVVTAILLAITML